MTVGLEHYATSEFIVGRLSSDATLLALLPNGAQSIFEEVAPEDTVGPWIVFQLWTPAEDIRGVGTTRVGINGRWLVRATIQGASYAPLKDIVAKADAVLHNAPIGITVADGTVFSSWRVQAYKFGEVQGGQQYRHMGGIYAIMTQG